MSKLEPSCPIPPRWAVALAAALFGLAAFSVVASGGMSIDQPIYRALAGLQSPALNAVVTCLTQLGGTVFLVAACAVAAVLFWRLWGWRLAVVCGGNLALTSLCNWLIKQLVQRPRPGVLRLVEESGYSFPSGHSCCSMAFYGLLAIILLARLRGKKRKWIAAGLGLLVLAIGLSRVYVGVHYASDVLAGWCGGFVWLGCITRIPRVRAAISGKEAAR